MTRRKGAAVLGAALLLALLANEFVVVGVKSAATADDGSKQTRRVRSQSAHLASLVRVVRGAVALCETFLDECWLDSGTLLGARRSGRVLRWDEDGDLGVSRAAHLKLSALSAANKLDTFLAERTLRLDWTGRVEDVIARVVDPETELYVDLFVYFRYERDKPLENLFSRKVGLHLTETEKVAWERGGLMHGVFSRAWTGTCMSCKTRRKDDRKVPVLPADWIFPLRRCEIEDVSAWCPHETERVLTYMYGESFLTPPASTRPAARLALYAAVVLGAYLAWGCN
mmetsp:Transcript_8650/g.23451  ORF Transcript_8650/g.23451 Transcript_8650/m.23451 type:complete len:284 (+) Transcript_8650:199-1050(+)